MKKYEIEELERKDRNRRLKSPIDRPVRREHSPIMSYRPQSMMVRNDPYEDFAPPPRPPKERPMHGYKILCVGKLILIL